MTWRGPIVYPTAMPKEIVKVKVESSDKEVWKKAVKPLRFDSLSSLIRVAVWQYIQDRKRK